MKKKEPKQIAKKVPKQPKDFIPPSMIKNLHPTEHILPQPNNSQARSYVEVLAPSQIMPEWTYQSTEEVNAEIYKDEPESLFEDPEHRELTLNLPLSFVNATENEICWDRPSTYAVNYYLDRDIQLLYPKKSYTSMREDIKKSYYNKIQQQSENSDSAEEEDDIDAGMSLF